jgi:small subunit ribosomal protein S18
MAYSNYNNGSSNVGGGSDDKGVKRPMRRMPRKKVCGFCQEKVGSIDFKDVVRLKRYITEKGKIIPRRMSGVCSAHQLHLATAIKRARIMALLPFVAE